MQLSCNPEDFGKVGRGVRVGAKVFVHSFSNSISIRQHHARNLADVRFPFLDGEGALVL